MIRGLVFLKVQDSCSIQDAGVFKARPVSPVSSPHVEAFREARR